MIVYKNGKVFKHTYIPMKIEFNYENRNPIRGANMDDCGCMICMPINKEMPNRLDDKMYYLEDGEIGIAIYQDPEYNSKNLNGENIELITNNSIYGVVCMYDSKTDTLISRNGNTLELDKIIFYSSLPSDVQNIFR